MTILPHQPPYSPVHRPACESDPPLQRRRAWRPCADGEQARCVRGAASRPARTGIGRLGQAACHYPPLGTRMLTSLAPAPAPAAGSPPPATAWWPATRRPAAWACLSATTCDSPSSTSGWPGTWAPGSCWCRPPSPSPQVRPRTWAERTWAVACGCTAFAAIGAEPGGDCRAEGEPCTR